MRLDTELVKNLKLDVVNHPGRMAKMKTPTG
jgi:hypothetical protein